MQVSELIEDALGVVGSGHRVKRSSLERVLLPLCP